MSFGPPGTVAGQGEALTWASACVSSVAADAEIEHGAIVR